VRRPIRSASRATKPRGTCRRRDPSVRQGAQPDWVFSAELIVPARTPRNVEETPSPTATTTRSGSTGAVEGAATRSRVDVVATSLRNLRGLHDVGYPSPNRWTVAGVQADHNAWARLRGPHGSQPSLGGNFTNSLKTCWRHRYDSARHVGPPRPGWPVAADDRDPGAGLGDSGRRRPALLADFGAEVISRTARGGDEAAAVAVGGAPRCSTGPEPQQKSITLALRTEAGRKLALPWSRVRRRAENSDPHAGALGAWARTSCGRSGRHRARAHLRLRARPALPDRPGSGRSPRRSGGLRELTGDRTGPLAR